MPVAGNMMQLAYIWLQFPLLLSYFSSYRIFISKEYFSRKHWHNLTHKTNLSHMSHQYFLLLLQYDKHLGKNFPSSCSYIIMFTEGLFLPNAVCSTCNHSPFWCIICLTLSQNIQNHVLFRKCSIPCKKKLYGPLL